MARFRRDVNSGRVLERFRAVLESQGFRGPKTTAKISRFSGPARPLNAGRTPASGHWPCGQVSVGSQRFSFVQWQRGSRHSPSPALPRGLHIGHASQIALRTLRFSRSVIGKPAPTQRAKAARRRRALSLNAIVSARRANSPLCRQRGRGKGQHAVGSERSGRGAQGVGHARHRISRPLST